jgi:hypothetical protein
VNAPPGGVLNGRYELRTRLVDGGMGTVWEAYDRVLARRVAAKALIPEADYGADLQVMRERMRREALALALVDHPAVVTVHDLIYDSEDPWIVMGYVDGPTLAQYVNASPRPPEREIASIGLVVLQGLLACHAKKVYHRDVKPTNIIRTPDGSARLVDFGIARIGSMKTLTPSSKLLGTPEFMAPELFENQAASPWTDLWSLGATLYYALERQSPFAKPSLLETIKAIGSKHPPSPPRNPGPLADLVMWMLRKQPSARPDAKAVLGELRKIADGSAPAGRPAWGERPPCVRQSPTVPMKDPLAEWDEPVVRPPGKAGDTWVRSPVKPLTRLSGLSPAAAAEIIVSLPPDRAVADLLALEDDEAAKILLQTDAAVAGKLLSQAAAAQPAWTRKIIEMVARSRAGQLLDKMTVMASASALALPPAHGAAQVLLRADDATVKAVLSELARNRPSRGAPLVLALDDLETGRVAQVLGNSDPVTVARLLHYVSTPGRRETLLNRLPRLVRPLVDKHLRSLEDSD